MDEKEYLYRGWDFAAKLAGAEFATDQAASYVAEVEAAIKELENGIVSLKSNQTDASLGGFLAEEWHARTFNIDAIADGSAHRAERLGVTGYGSVDIQTNFGENYSGKYMATAEKSATAQATLNRDTGAALYEGQKRLIPTDHLDGAKAHAHQQALRNSEIRPDVANAYSDTENQLVDRIKDADGHESRALSKSDDLKMARDVKNDRFTAEKYGVDLESVIKADYIIDHGKSLQTYTTTEEVENVLRYDAKSVTKYVPQEMLCSEKNPFSSIVQKRRYVILKALQKRKLTPITDLTAKINQDGMAIDIETVKFELTSLSQAGFQISHDHDVYCMQDNLILDEQKNVSAKIDASSQDSLEKSIEHYVVEYADSIPSRLVDSLIRYGSTGRDNCAEFEGAVTRFFTFMGYESTQLGQGNGRVADVIARYRDNMMPRSYTLCNQGDTKREGR